MFKALIVTFGLLSGLTVQANGLQAIYDSNNLIQLGEPEQVSFFKQLFDDIKFSIKTSIHPEFHPGF